MYTAKSKVWETVSLKNNGRSREIPHTRYKNPYDNLLYCILLQALYDLYENPLEQTRINRHTAKSFFEDGTAKTFYEYLKGCEKK